jgi:hypothetical protein
VVGASSVVDTHEVAAISVEKESNLSFTTYCKTKIELSHNSVDIAFQESATAVNITDCMRMREKCLFAKTSIKHMTKIRAITHNLTPSRHRYTVSSKHLVNTP